MKLSVGKTPFYLDKPKLRQDQQINLKKIEAFLERPEEFRKAIETPLGRTRLPFSNLMIGFIMAKLISAVPALVAKLLAIFFPEEKRLKNNDQLSWFDKLAKAVVNNEHKIVGLYYMVAGAFAFFVPYSFRVLLFGLGALYSTYFHHLDQKKTDAKKQILKFKEQLKKMKDPAKIKEIKQKIKILETKRDKDGGMLNISKKISLLLGFAATIPAILANKSLTGTKYRFDEFKAYEKSLEESLGKSMDTLDQNKTELEKIFQLKFKEDLLETEDVGERVKKAVDQICKSTSSKLEAEIQSLGLDLNLPALEDHQGFYFHRIDSVQEKTEKASGGRKERALKAIDKHLSKLEADLNQFIDIFNAGIKRDLRFIPDLTKGATPEMLFGYVGIDPNPRHKNLVGIERAQSSNIFEAFYKNIQKEADNLVQLFKPSQIKEEWKSLFEGGRYKELENLYEKKEGKTKGDFLKSIQKHLFVFNESSISFYLFGGTFLTRIASSLFYFLSAQQNGVSQFSDDKKAGKEKHLLTQIADGSFSIAQGFSAISSFFTIDGNPLGLTLSTIAGSTALFSSIYNYLPIHHRRDGIYKILYGLEEGSLVVGSVCAGLAANANQFSSLTEATLSG